MQRAVAPAMKEREIAVPTGNEDRPGATWHGLFGNWWNEVPGRLVQFFSPTHSSHTGIRALSTILPRTCTSHSDSNRFLLLFCPSTCQGLQIMLSQWLISSNSTTTGTNFETSCVCNEHHTWHVNGRTTHWLWKWCHIQLKTTLFLWLLYASVPLD